MLFVFESDDGEDAFLAVAASVRHAPFFTSNLDMIASRDVLGTSWRLPPPNPPDRAVLASLAMFQNVPGSRDRHFL